ncbi:MAG: hypothetical protein COA99_12280 [Moraxellaceae bacterium]|nr:MAG: hypothetical protein COA99_12280 [Moraxellaceae bacterium]
MSHPESLVPYIGFNTTDAMRGKLTLFLDATAANDPKAGPLFVEFISVMTDHLIDTLLLEIIHIADVNKVGQKVIKLCATTAGKISTMLTGKIFKKLSPKQLAPVADLWQKFLINTEENNHGDWYLLSPISQEYSNNMDAILEEKGDASNYEPKDLNTVMMQFDELVHIIIDSFFLTSTREVPIGTLTNKLLTSGVNTVEKGVAAVLQKVVRKFEPNQFGLFVEHMQQLYIRL